MKLGFVSSVLAGYTFEQVIDFAKTQGFDCVEMACWPEGKAERRYGGVTHIDVNGLTDEKAAFIKNCCALNGVEISSLAYYPNTMDGDLEKRAFYIEHLKKVILASEKLGIHMVTTFIGRVTDRSMDENLEIFAEVWPPIVAFAQEHHVKIAIENCPMWFTNDEWPGGQNIAVSPSVWRKMFQIIPSASLGINYDPSHFILQHMDYIKPLYEFKDRIYHIHYKDIRIFQDRLDDLGTMANPALYTAPKIPGHGDINWAAYVSALRDIGFEGYTCIEIEDRSFEGSDRAIEESLILSKRYLNQFIF